MAPRANIYTIALVGLLQKMFHFRPMVQNVEISVVCLTLLAWRKVWFSAQNILMMPHESREIGSKFQEST
jgi:hypothetical protein